MTAGAPNLIPMARRTHVSTQSLDAYVVGEIRAAMARADAERVVSPEFTGSRFTVAELAELTKGHLNAEQLGRRFRGETGLTLDDVDVLGAALGVEGWALLKAATMRRRIDAGESPTGGLRERVSRGPGGLPVIQ